MLASFGAFYAAHYDAVWACVAALTLFIPSPYRAITDTLVGMGKGLSGGAK